MRTMRSSPTQAARTYHRIRSGHTFPKHNFITYVVANPPIRFVMSLCFISYFITSALLLQIPIKQRNSGNVLLSQVFPHVLNPPQAAHTGEPNQVHSLTSLKTTGE